jgi:hypothetical protein
MAKRNGNREFKKPKQEKAKAAGASSIAELAKTQRASILAPRKR